MARAKPRRPTKPPAALVFGEGTNDRDLLVHLVRALHPDAPKPEPRRSPLILQKDRDEAGRRKNAADVAAIVQRERRIREVPYIVAHQDCDALEPAHKALSSAVEESLAGEEIVAVAATPAWEMEAWLYHWPDAFQKLNPKWRKLKRTGDLGLVENAKETLTHDLRPAAKDKTRDYEEADSVRVVKLAIELGLPLVPPKSAKTKCASYQRFLRRLDTVVAQYAG